MTKQFVALFILVVIAIIAGVTFTNIVIYESTQIYDLDVMYGSIFSFLDTVVFKLAEQNGAVEFWISEATREVQMAEAELFYWNEYIFEIINGT
jgi:hypothetical protein